MATYPQDDDHDRITHVDMLNLLRQDMREGFAQQREAFNGRFDALDSKVDTNFDALDSKVDTNFDALDSKVDTKVDALDSKVETKFDGVDTRFDGVETKFDGVDTRFDIVDDKIDAVDDKVDTQVGSVDSKIEAHIADHTAQANESRTGRRWLIGIAIGVGITVSGLAGQYLPAIIRALQSGP